MILRCSYTIQETEVGDVSVKIEALHSAASSKTQSLYLPYFQENKRYVVKGTCIYVLKHEVHPYTYQQSFMKCLSVILGNLEPPKHCLDALNVSLS